MERWRNEYLIQFIGTAAPRPALTNVVATGSRTGKATGNHDIRWDLMVLGKKNRTDHFNGCKQPSFTIGVLSHVAHFLEYIRLKFGEP
jgi:hypothetical protein